MGEALLVWTEAYTPWIMGGDVNAPIGARLKCGERIELGGGFFGYVFTSPLSGKTCVAEEQTGAIVGPTVEQVRADIEEAEPAVMAKQIEQALKRRRSVRTLSPDAFWARYR